jgi:flavin reductase (DIM6/NTAB) family NADH-FMN oxidoreductase RutF
MVAGWQMRCSYTPPMFAVSLSKKGHTHKLIRERGEFVVALPNNDLEKYVEFFGSNHGDQVNKFKKSGIETVPGKFIGLPLIKEATFNFECKLEKEVEAGDHIIFIGSVLAAYHNSEKGILLNMGKVEGKRIFKEF